jgi:prepilin-type N-terminal cleavage/methylation domain-containing protein
MKGGKHKQPLGYTIVEVMIVLAISGIMFLIAADFINGKQENASFTTGVNEFSTELQDTIDQVTDGQYSDALFNCLAQPNGTSVTINITGSSPTGQGTHSTCVYLGKILYFYSPSAGQDADQYENFSLAGSQLNQSSIPPSNIGDSWPKPIIGGGVDLTVHQLMPDSLQLTEPIKITGNYASTTYAIGFVNQWPAGRSGGCNSSTTLGACYFGSGVEPTQLVYAPNLTAPDSDHPTTGTSPESYGSSRIQYNLAGAITAEFCLTDGTQYAEVDIGSNGGSDLNVQTKIFSTNLCQ